MKRIVLAVLSILGILILVGCTDNEDNLPTSYSVTINTSGAEEGESVSVNVSEAAEGATVTLTASLNSGRQVVLSASGVPISPSIISSNEGTATFTMPAADVEVTATFSDIPTYAITISTGGAEDGESVSVNVSEAAEGATVTLTASLNSGRQVVLSASGVTISPSIISSNEGTATFTMPAADVEVTATFSDIPTYAITISSGGAESGESVIANVSEAIKGATVTLTASLNSGRQVVLSASGVTISPSIISSNEGTATFTMPAADVEVTANFFLIPGASFSHIANTVSFNMNYVPSGGTFIMGESVEETTQKVTLTKNFWMGETEVTQGLWEDVWGDDWPGNDPADLNFGVGANYPAYYVSWYDSAAFCNLLTIADASIDATEQVYYSDAEMIEVYTKDDAKNKKFVYANWTKNGYRLPTEAEWEYAARYIDGVNWNGGDHVSGGPIYDSDYETIKEYAWFFQNNASVKGTKVVGQKKENALGLYDMSGNVLEWCFDWKANYSGSDVTDPIGSTSGSARVYRGGHFNAQKDEISCAYRNQYAPDIRGNAVGFRLCRTAD